MFSLVRRILRHLLKDELAIAVLVVLALHSLGAEPPRLPPNYAARQYDELNKKAEFDAIWNWARTYMYHDSSTHPCAKRFVESVWDARVPSGEWRYADGLLHLLGRLHCSGEFRIWPPK